MLREDQKFILLSDDPHRIRGLKALDFIYQARLTEADRNPTEENQGGTGYDATSARLLRKLLTDGMIDIETELALLAQKPETIKEEVIQNFRTACEKLDNYNNTGISGEYKLPNRSGRENHEFSRDELPDKITLNPKFAGSKEEPRTGLYKKLDKYVARRNGPDAFYLSKLLEDGELNVSAAMTGASYLVESGKRSFDDFCAAKASLCKIVDYNETGRYWNTAQTLEGVDVPPLLPPPLPAPEKPKGAWSRLWSALGLKSAVAIVGAGMALDQQAALPKETDTSMFAAQGQVQRLADAELQRIRETGNGESRVNMHYSGAMLDRVTVSKRGGGV